MARTPLRSTPATTSSAVLAASKRVVMSGPCAGIEASWVMRGKNEPSLAAVKLTIQRKLILSSKCGARYTLGCELRRI
jgi:hypothetical protein